MAPTFFLKRLGVLIAPALLAACANAGSAPPRPTPSAPAGREAPPAPPRFEVPPRPAAFERVPGWSDAKLYPALKALSRSCARLAERDDARDLSAAAPWAGRVEDWKAPCASLATAREETSARSVIEALFLPVEVSSPDGHNRFTGYFEPVIAARHAPEPPFTAPVPGPPGDMVTQDNGVMQRLGDGTLRPYPPRSEITPVKPLGYARPADVFFLQIQGSGRLEFADGSAVRAAYHAHNDQPFRSTANWLLERGEISRGEAGMAGIRAWMGRVDPQVRREAMNANPRYVFFKAKPVGDPALGPVGAQGVALSPLGSIAVDTELHPLGVPYIVNTEAPGLGGEWTGLMISQDTGGAIRGAVRGDLFFGTGSEAGRKAGTMNAPGRLWVLLPRRLARALKAQASDDDPGRASAAS